MAEPPYTERGVKNAILLDPKALPIFEKIKQEKDAGASIPVIKKKMSNSDVPKIKQEKSDNKTNIKDDHFTDEWLGVKEAIKLSKKSETTIRRLVLKLKKDNNFRVIKKDDKKRDKWLISKQFVLEHFDIVNRHTPEYPTDNVSNKSIDIVSNKSIDIVSNKSIDNVSD
ncbi:MAG: hypothetical protein GY714_32810, partial [Desulfobacterales bacterium]|nr:hypothetical protein [Desulfobacterales bacterium]